MQRIKTKKWENYENDNKDCINNSGVERVDDECLFGRIVWRKESKTIQT